MSRCDLGAMMCNAKWPDSDPQWERCNAQAATAVWWVDEDQGGELCRLELCLAHVDEIRRLPFVPFAPVAVAGRGDTP